MFFHCCSVRGYQGDEGARVKTNENIQDQMNIHSKAVGNTKPDIPYALMTTGKRESHSPYQQLTSTTMRTKGDFEDMQKLSEMKRGLDGSRSQPGQVTLDDQIYDT